MSGRRAPPPNPLPKHVDLTLALTEMSVSGKKRDHPSIGDYYKAAAAHLPPTSPDRDSCITYQHGLSNYSSVVLGDDRVSFKKSISQDAFRLDTARQERMNTSTASLHTKRSANQLRNDYREATELVGEEKITQMEQMMRSFARNRTRF